ncbi:uncharacterized protein Z519_00052 [Cladophialophora bantiana CBS 173.52]|uniref:Uncharacterized protein n=1 Tax=Cladophialophora bantiana (strain ATCC 10958 / CBS 173.52 / CDC B-1940 / NIH 8579) TaxID=1442370 RepID=A0A0D2GJ26_CLAB1|nr:uncharacterized protein Z519_00052 [Cladophialophora bantiana CBS 173.52]KIW98392.1 hypothetical protein Z519_00052 [Cladophialophora bantiana CBS 173.52]
MTRQKAREVTIHAADAEDDRDFLYKRPETVSSCGSHEDRPNHATGSSILKDRYEMEKRSDIFAHRQSLRQTPEQFTAVAVEDNSPSRVNSDRHFSNWPYNCCYFVPELMNAEGAISLLNSDAEFYPADCNTLERLKVVDSTETGTSSFDLSPLESEFDDLLQLFDLNHGSTRILFISQKRRCPKNRTTNMYGLKHSTWFTILSSCDIPPDAVQLIHENNGCWGAHTSYCSDVRSKTCPVKSPDDSIGETLSAYHIRLKPRPWWNEEHFVYARHCFHSRKKLLLVVGTSLEAQQQRLLSQFHSATEPQFSVLLALTTTWTKDLKENFVGARL